MRNFIISALVLLLCILSYLFIGKQTVSVIDAHYDGSTAQIIVNRLPITESGKIDWWRDHQQKILEKYNIPSGNKRPFLITVYAFGDGYKEEGKEDRRCFTDIKPPKNCIDKNILMMIWRTRDGSVKYQF
ncbi:DUF943 family protein [Paramixta manurensis]|uniref:DUF943 family protein n=1 Tax=Paramixta manurensis TaxID=2740817 RepID=A0A6M8UHD5_9GAMM|nr:DUF943 family protein [Erwiniaceae bacterium PD-1]